MKLVFTTREAIMKILTLSQIRSLLVHLSNERDRDHREYSYLTIMQQSHYYLDKLAR